MQFLNDDSSEWMRKAAADYPVKPFGMNWEAVAEQLHDDPAPEQGITGYVLLRYAAMVVFFMLLSLVCNKYLQIDFGNGYVAVSSNQPAKGDHVINKIGQTINTDETKVKQEKQRIRSSESYATRLTKDQVSVEKGVNKFSLEPSGYINEPKEASLEVISFGLDHQRKLNNATAFRLPDNPVPVLRHAIEKENTESNSESQEKLVTKKGIQLNKRIYAGLLLGPDVSTVKLQKTEGVGYNVGLFVGYKLSAKWHLESGFLLNRKEYYSEGKHFNTNHAYLPSHSYITNVDGYCTMFEIPLNIRYNITSKEKGGWFATAGISSYLMNKENYNYTYKRYNVEYKGSKVYRNASKDWMSVMNASMGYEKTINQKIQFRIEPYVKLPLRGMGTGKLPISSAGMNIGVSYPIK